METETIYKELYEDKVDEERHHFVMEDLAKSLKVSLEDVIEPYEQSLREIKERARIKDYIVLLVVREVKALLKEKSAR